LIHTNFEYNKLSNYKSKILSPDTGNNDVILVINRDTNNQALFKNYLCSEGYQVEFAKNDKEAIVFCSQNPLNLIIINNFMTNTVNLNKLCKKLKSSEKNKYIPTILIIDGTNNEDWINGIEAKVDEFICIPFNKIELLTRIKSLLRIKKINDSLQHKIIELQVAQTKLEHLAITDGLTDLFNYRYFKNQFNLEVSRSSRYGLPVSLAMIDIDHFKIYNDLFGHPSGDQILKKIAQLLSNNIRKVDVLARYGGEEFVLILPGTDKKSALIVGEKLRKLIEQFNFPNEEQLPLGKLTVSIGISTYPQDTEDENELIVLSDKNLYRSKREGRNRITI
jgi:diguanylate cyclase (GGDEF)-like protein